MNKCIIVIMPRRLSEPGNETMQKQKGLSQKTFANHSLINFPFILDMVEQQLEIH